MAEKTFFLQLCLVTAVAKIQVAEWCVPLGYRCAVGSSQCCTVGGIKKNTWAKPNDIWCNPKTEKCEQNKTNDQIQSLVDQGLKNQTANKADKDCKCMWSAWKGQCGICGGWHKYQDKVVVANATGLGIKCPPSLEKSRLEWCEKTPKCLKS